MDRLRNKLEEVDALLRAATVSGASGNYEYLLGIEGIPEFSRLPKPVSTRRFDTKGLFRHRKRYAAEFSRPIPLVLVLKYDLTPLSAHDPIIVEEARGLFQADVLDALIGPNKQFRLSLGSKTLVFAEAADTRRHVSLMLFDAGKNLLDSRDYDDMDEAIKVLWSHLSPAKRSEYAESMVPRM